MEIGTDAAIKEDTNVAALGSDNVSEHVSDMAVVLSLCVGIGMTTRAGGQTPTCIGLSRAVRPCSRE
jgi:hypothetical protein